MATLKVQASYNSDTGYGARIELCIAGKTYELRRDQFADLYRAVIAAEELLRVTQPNNPKQAIEAAEEEFDGL